MYRCRICDVPDEDELCPPCLDLEKRLDSLISCEPERALLYIEHKLRVAIERVREKVGLENIQIRTRYSHQSQLRN